ncbi:hypothetical protein [Chryseobacterium chendengshani]|uniref:hypothetical protein n=1 Tax=unclassified Chryseobacterium TaxID=2593645 RepID=UPI001C63DEEE|nr:MULTISPECIES: hypothetical protein [unclassified Chryseobacterium]MBW7675306.1 hypothetical protein [Chryseobacterium sp. LJ756]MBW8522119.1 hypothetical protein [Chryseobacterium sp. LJ668]QYK17766.1 hypothetical protein K0U91_06500 [Chryseobacterium sp. LJ668]
MKKIFFFLILSGLLSAQKTEVIDLSKSIKDSKNTYKSFRVIDQRPNKDIGSILFHKNQVNIIFENDASKDLSDWFYKYNIVKGSDDLVLLLENLNISEDIKEKYSIGKLELRASIFKKREDGYHFVNKIDTVATLSSRDTPYLAQSLAKKITLSLADLLKDSYTKTTWEFGISENDLTNYNSVLIDKLDILKSGTLKEGVYKDSYSFFTHNPETGYTIETNSKGVATKAVKGDDKKPIRNFYAFVHNGVPYKVIPVGYVEIFRDDMGLFIEVKKEELFPESNSTMVMLGGGIGGLIGSVVANVAFVAIDASIAKKRRAMAGTEVSLDPLTGNYILPENFGKSK